MTRDLSDSPSRSRPWRTILIVMALAFLGGSALMGWALTHWAPAQRLLPVPSAEAPASAGPEHASQPIVSGGSVATSPTPPPAPDDARVAALEVRLTDIDRHAALAADQASRAEGMLIAFAARRAVERGVALGYLEGQLNGHFGTPQPRAVANIIAASHAPVTLDGLRAALDGVMTEAVPVPSNGDWWGRLRANFSGLITVRKAGELSAAPDERLTRARLALSTGAVENALAEVARLPGGRSTNAWMANARRYIEAHSALDVIEAAALTTPEQPKPVSGPAPAIAPPPPTTTDTNPVNEAGAI